jgi:hypothetical protein
MTTTNKGGPAFPTEHPSHDQNKGMPLRDYFAGQALMGLIASGFTAYDLRDCDDQAAYAAFRAYTAADAMLAAREKANG